MTLRRAVLDEVPVIAVIGAFVALAWTLSAATGYPWVTDWLGGYRMFGVFVLLYAAGALLLTPVHTVIIEKRSLRRPSTWRRMAEKYAAPRKLAGFLLVFGAVGLLLPAFQGFKRSITEVRPFSWDSAFMAWDRWLHFGSQPFEWLQPLLGHPPVTAFIDRVYILWFPVIATTLIWQAWHGSRKGVTRQQYLLSFALCSILLGSLAATLLSSAGPVYFSDVTGSTGPYSPLLNYLDHVDLMYDLKAPWAHDLLWTAHVEREAIAVGGISAMPSMHIALVVLQARMGFAVNRWLGWAYAIFALLIFLGSIHLAWHYAIDGYVSLVGVLGIWWVSGRVIRWWNRVSDRPASQPARAPAPLGTRSTDQGADARERPTTPETASGTG